MKRMKRAAPAGLLLWACLPGAPITPACAEPAREAPSPSPAKRLRAQLSAMVDAGEIPGAIALVVQHGRPLLSVRVGYGDVATRTPMAEDAIFRLYSMTKPVTTVAVMMLAEDGRLSLGDPVGRYLPELAGLRVYGAGTQEPLTTVPAARPVTIEDLLLHRSGITYEFMGNTPVHQFYRRHGISRATAVASTRAQAAPARTLDELVARLGTAPLLHQPGERFSYGFSTTVLGAVIERVSGEKLDRFLKRRVFGPLDMPDTAFVVDDRHLPRLVTNYAASDGGLRAVDEPATSEYRDPGRLLDGGGALTGTMRDYLHFAEMLAQRGKWKGRRILAAKSVDAMFTPRLRTGAATPEDDSPFGYGLAIGDAGTEAIGMIPRGAGGWSGSAGTYFFADPAHGAAAILMTNVLSPPPYTARAYRLRALLDQAALAVIER
ncbi:CubicO group peptidase, beta-lactamase class C family [Novosphingobium sp. CF614]|uniref:serine hydrolase domain-containing protein n=1 Tax=Novosphingobium sp. CF614 TaxID=1884364 RepID=UPI0008F3D6B6|nr:serine hydrolase domain-containing protein [Novosphingobium sp. CF614]SFG27391.1 CubicO group peptidase, beta-lactamase class C family [Novosphingobium sp. CF614]